MTEANSPWDGDARAASAQRLGVAINASSGRLRAAFRTQALRWHPDHNADPAAHERFREIREAYRVLTDAQSSAEQNGVLVQPISCRTCGASDRHLRAVTVTRLRSYLLFSRTTATNEIHCRRCAQKRLLTASLLSGTIGSWSLTGLPLAIAVAGHNAQALGAAGSVDLRLALHRPSSAPTQADARLVRNRLFGLANVIAALASPAVVAACLIYRFA